MFSWRSPGAMKVCMKRQKRRPLTIRSSASSPTPTTPAMPRSTRLRSSNRALLVAALAFALVSCAGRNIHRELRADEHVLERGWTLRTRTQFEAGDRGAEYSNPILVPPNGPAEGTLVFGNQSVGLISIYPGLNQQR